MTILLEQWPHRMAYIFVVLEIYERRNLINGQTDVSIFGSNVLETGGTIVSILDKIAKNEKISTGDDESIFLLYKHLIQVLMFSSDDNSSQLHRDGDARRFEDLLLESGIDQPILTVKDIGCSQSSLKENVLSPFSFNLPKYMTAKVNVDMSKIIIIIRENTRVYNMKQGWYVTFEKKKVFFDNATKNEWFVKLT